MPQPPGLPYCELRADPSDPEMNYLGWREAVAPIFDADVREREDIARFCAEQRTYEMGSMVVSGVAMRAGAHRFQRLPVHVAATGLDLFLVQTFIEGGDRRLSEGEETGIEPGDVVIADLTRTLATQTGTFSNLSFIIPRALFADRVADLDALHGTVLRGSTAAGHLMHRHMRAVWSFAPRMSMQDGPAATKATVELLASFVEGTGAGQRRGALGSPLAKLFAIRRHIEQNLGSELTPAQLCDRFALSRASLYRLFEPLGGIAEYIRKRRLQRALLLLSQSEQRYRPIGEIARAAGFTDISSFSRAFRARFGLPPNEVRELAAAGQPLPAGEEFMAGELTLPQMLQKIDAG